MHQCVTDVNNCLSDGHFSSHALRIKHNLGPTVYLFVVHFWQFRARFSGHQSNAIEVCLHCIYSHRQLNIPLENILCLGQGLLAQTTTRSPFPHLLPIFPQLVLTVLTFHQSFPFTTARSPTRGQLIRRPREYALLYLAQQTCGRLAQW